MVINYFYYVFQAFPDWTVPKLERIRATIGSLRTGHTGLGRMADDPNLRLLFEEFRVQRPQAAVKFFPAGSNNLTVDLRKLRNYLAGLGSNNLDLSWTVHGAKLILQIQLGATRRISDIQKIYLPEAGGYVRIGDDEVICLAHRLKDFRPTAAQYRKSEWKLIRIPRDRSTAAADVGVTLGQWMSRLNAVRSRGDLPATRIYVGTERPNSRQRLIWTADRHHRDAESGTLRHWAHGLMVEAGIPKEFTPHKICHAVATERLLRGANVEQVVKGRWSSVRTFHRFYDLSGGASPTSLRPPLHEPELEPGFQESEFEVSDRSDADLESTDDDERPAGRGKQGQRGRGSGRRGGRYPHHRGR